MAFEFGVTRAPRPVRRVTAQATALGVEWVVDASGCDASRLRDRAGIERFLDLLMTSLRLTAAAPRVVHVFPGEGGVTAMVLLTESHLTVHTFPEHGALTMNLYCCKARPRFDWTNALGEHFGARAVDVRELAREAPASERGEHGGPKP